MWRPKPTSLVVRERVDDGDKGRNDEGDGADSTIVTDIYFCLAIVRHCAKFFARVTPFNTFNISEVGSVVFSIL